MCASETLWLPWPTSKDKFSFSHLTRTSCSNRGDADQHESCVHFCPEGQRMQWPLCFKLKFSGQSLSVLLKFLNHRNLHFIMVTGRLSKTTLQEIFTICSVLNKTLLKTKSNTSDFKLDKNHIRYNNPEHGSTSILPITS